MSGGSGDTVASGVIEDKIEKKEKTAWPPSWPAGLRDLPLPLYFTMTPTLQPEGRGRGFGGVWGGGEGFVTPAGIGVSVPPRDKSLPFSQQFKLGTKKYVYVLFLVLFHFFCLGFIQFHFFHQVGGAVCP